VLRAGARPDEATAKEGPSRASGWIDLERVKVDVDTAAEWRQMAREAWRLQREYFWTEDMSHVDWDAVWERYEPLVERLGTRGEFSDTSCGRCRASSGPRTPTRWAATTDRRRRTRKDSSARITRSTKRAGRFVVARVVEGNAGRGRCGLAAQRAGRERASRRSAARDQRPTVDKRDVVPQQLLVHRADAEVTLTVQGADGVTRSVPVRAAKSETAARYREWVEANRRRVHDATSGRAGYVHVPDMGPRGFAEFHRLFLAEADRDALLVDVRFNRGGHVSQLLIEKLARKRVGYDVNRWGAPAPYPEYSVGGPMVALTNEFAGSDGDIFSHVFKLMRLGPLVGKRTWGGGDRHLAAEHALGRLVHDAARVLVLVPGRRMGRRKLRDRPGRRGRRGAAGLHAAGRDPQLERAIELLLERLATTPRELPPFDERPDLAPKILFGKATG
jgi:tricorn protease